MEKMNCNWKYAIAIALCFHMATASVAAGKTNDELSDLKEHKQMLLEIENYIYELDDPNKVLFEDKSGNMMALDRVSFEKMIYHNALQKIWNNKYLTWDELKSSLPAMIRQQREQYNRESGMIKERLRIVQKAAEEERKTLQARIDRMESGAGGGKVDLSSATGLTVFQDDFDGEATNTVYNFGKKGGEQFRQWTVASGDVDLVVEGSNAFVDLDGSTTWGTANGSRDKAQSGRLESREAIHLQPGEYVLKFKVRGNPYQGGRDKDKNKPNKFKVTLGPVVFMESNEIQMAHGSSWEDKELSFTLRQPLSAKLIFDHTIVAGDWDGLFLDDVRIVKYP